MSARPWSLRRRLVTGFVVLVALTSVAIGMVSVVTVRQSLLAQVDSELALATARSQAFVADPHAMPEFQAPPGAGVGQRAKTLGVIIVDERIVRPQYVDEVAVFRALTPAQQAAIVGVTSRTPVTVDLGGELGEYRLVASETRDGQHLVVGVPMAEMTATIWQIVGVIVAIALAALLIASLLAVTVVRVGLRPLRRVVDTAERVIALPLGHGEVALAERIPDSAAHPGTEVGSVGSALNRLLDHVDASLRARQASESRVRQFVADASHELRTPLASIRGYSELTRLTGAKLPPDVAHALSRIESESIRMSGLVDELLLLARLDEGAELRQETVVLGPLIERAVEDARAGYPGHRWLLELTAGEVRVTGDEARLHQAVTNLLRNAGIHTPEGTRVRTSLRPAGERVLIEVADDGPGIAPEIADTLFERFVRGDGSRSRASGSSGLGLAIVKAIAEAHGGSVSVTSEPGDTRFVLELPRA